jgi:uncharacterized protein YkwD
MPPLRLPLVLVGLAIQTGCIIDVLREDPVGEAAACEAARRWPRAYAEREDELLDLVNEVRAGGGTCGEALQNPVPDLELSPELRCAARVHATDLAESGGLEHEGSDGSTTLSRVDRAQYDGIPKHELLAADFLDPQAVLAAWLGDPSHCEPLFDPTIDAFGVGHAMSANEDAAAWVLLTGENRE